MRIIHIAELTLQSLSIALDQANSEVRLLRMENAQLLEQIVDFESFDGTIEKSISLKDAKIKQLELDLDGQMVANANFVDDLMEAEKRIIDLLEKQREGELRYNALMSKMDGNIVDIKKILFTQDNPAWVKLLTKIKFIISGNSKPLTDAK